MSRHNIKSEMEKGIFPTSGRAFQTTDGYLLGWGSTDGTVNGTAVENWAPGAIFIVTTAASETFHQNTGTKTTAAWANVA